MDQNWGVISDDICGGRSLGDRHIREWWRKPAQRMRETSSCLGQAPKRSIREWPGVAVTG